MPGNGVFLNLTVVAALAVVCCGPVVAQVAVRERDTRAYLKGGVTTVSLALQSRLDKQVSARIELKWVSPQDEQHGQSQIKVTVRPGDSALDVVLPLRPEHEALDDRLLYRVAPDETDLTAFTAVNGALSFSHIADYAFSLRAIGLGVLHAGEPYALQLMTTHPITGRPVAGVRVQSGDVAALSDANGRAVLKLAVDEDGSLAEDLVEGQLGDFQQSVSIGYVPAAHRNVRIHCDKPLYRPGQTVHIRMLAFGTDGKADAETEYQLQIESPDESLQHTAKLKGSRFGIAAEDWQIPENAAAGDYQIKVEHPEHGEVAVHTISVRSYELPSFKVNAKALRLFYLPNERAVLEVRADYLFGKPVTSGTVRITQGDEADNDEVASGVLNSRGVYRGSLKLQDKLSGTSRFLDLSLTAFVTEPGTNRTEQQKFVVRISKDPLHVYLAKQESTATGQRIYVTAYSPDGAPAKANIEVLASARVVARAVTNRFGIARLDVQNTEGSIRLRALSTAGLQVQQEMKLGEGIDQELWLSTSKVIHRQGEGVECSLESRRKNLAAQLVAWNEDGRILYSKDVILGDAPVAMTIPYAQNFGRVVQVGVFAGVAGKMPVRTVVFPQANNLTVSSDAAAVYRPGDTVKLQLKTSAPAALGIAIVDESVREQAATDAVFGRHRWLSEDYGEPRISDVSYSDLLGMDAGKIDEEIQLLAELLVDYGQTPMVNSSEGRSQYRQALYEEAIRKKMLPLKSKLDEIYGKTLAYPRDDGAYSQMGDPSLRDPWMESYRARFLVDGFEDVMELWSSGPDKTAGTDDDFSAFEIRRKWFARFESIMRDALRKLEDYPASTVEASAVFEQGGLHFAGLKDPWQSALRLQIAVEANRRMLTVLSAGPDRKFGTPDDVTVCTFRGSYFSRTGRTVQKAIDASQKFPKTEAEVLGLAASAGVDLTSVRDHWGHRYFVVHRADETYYDKVSFYTFAEFGHPEEMRKELKPAKRKLLVTELRSNGPDGIRGTEDDFAVYTFFRLADEPGALTPRRMERSARAANSGKGLLTGRVTDETGAAVANARVRLNGIYETHTDPNGKYVFSDLAGALYAVQFEAPGFQRGQVEDVPVDGDNVTDCDFLLKIGAVTETVNVVAEQVTLASAASVSPTIATPRVRGYFPETLYWQPELITDANGTATINFKLADTVTNWHVAIVASTIDGQVNESETQLRAFQPFQVSLNLPPVLTAGDRLELPVTVRNYLTSAEKVSVKAKAAEGLVAAGEPRLPTPITPDSVGRSSVSLTAERASADAKLQVSAIGQTASDAISQSTVIHPNGERMERSLMAIVRGLQALRFEVPVNMLPQSIRSEVKLYPSLMARLLENMAAQLKRPNGCGEQTISSSYPNLLVLQALRHSRLRQPELETRAHKNLQIGYERLKSYQTPEGAFRYWVHSQPDVALTAYAIQFLRKLKELVPVEEGELTRAAAWLKTQPIKDETLRAYSIGVLMEAGTEEALLGRLTELAKKAAEFQDPYEMAVFASAALDAKKTELAERTIRRLVELAQEEGGEAFWALRANTPFHGWGRAGQVETTAVVLSALAKWQKQSSRENSMDVSGLMNRAVLFLLKNTGQDGAWSSGQASIQALSALLASTPSSTSGKQTVNLLMNGTQVQTLSLGGGNLMEGPVTIDVARFLKIGSNEISIQSDGTDPMQAQVNAAWFQQWSGGKTTPEFSLHTGMSSGNVKVNEAVTYSVRVSRPAFRGYGMMIAEVGLPPGAEVDRGSLQALVADRNGGVDSYEVAPDHLTFYVWPQASELNFHFVFRPRFAMDARLAPSSLYDYYNPDPRVTLVPEVLHVH